MQELIGLVAFSFVCSASPGPNNLLLWASGAAFGTRRTLRHVVGTAIGIGAMALGSAAGLAAIVAALPWVGVAMRIAGSGYLLWLAWQIAKAGVLRQGVAGRPMGLLAAAGFQALNPKGWIFALGAVATFRPADLPPAVGAASTALVMMVVVIPSALLWAAGGGAMARLLERERTRRLVTAALAVLVAVSVVLVWA